MTTPRTRLSPKDRDILNERILEELHDTMDPLYLRLMHDRAHPDRLMLAQKRV